MAMTTDSRGKNDVGGNDQHEAGVAPSLFVPRSLAVALWVLVWQLASMVVGSNILLAGPIETLARLAELIVQPKFLSIVCFSSARILGGFIAAYVAAVALALVARRWPVVGALFAPAIQVLKTVPLACIIVLMLMWVGSRYVSGPAVFLVVFPAVYFSCAEGLANVDAKVGEMLSAFGVNGIVRLLVHTWPSVVPYLVGTAKNVCGMAWKAGVAAELIGSPMGSIGERIYQSKILLETADLFAWTIVVIALSAVCERLFVALIARSGGLSQKAALRLTRDVWASAEQDTDRVPSAIMLDGSIGYKNKVVLQGVHLNLCPGSRTVLCDISGAGKTTLLRTVAGLQPVLDGSLLLLPPTVSMVFQESRLVEQLTAIDNVSLVVGAQNREKVAQELLELLPQEALDVPVAELSGGQRRRVEVVRALLYPSSAVLLDEAFSSLDDESHAIAASFVRNRLAGRTLLAASHDANDAVLLGAKQLRLFE